MNLYTLMESAMTALSNDKRVSNKRWEAMRILYVFIQWKDCKIYKNKITNRFYKLYYKFEF